LTSGQPWLPCGSAPAIRRAVESGSGGKVIRDCAVLAESPTETVGQTSPSPHEVCGPVVSGLQRRGDEDMDMCSDSLSRPPCGSGSGCRGIPSPTDWNTTERSMMTRGERRRRRRRNVNESKSWTGTFTNQGAIAAELRDNRFLPSPKESGQNFGGWPTQRVESPVVVERRQRMQAAAVLKPR
jgi:hypothetical protein